MIHSLAEVQTNKIGKNTYVWQYSIILSEAVIGDNCNINCHTFIENDVKIGNNVTIKSGVYLWDGIQIADNVFVGPNVTFTNDERPRSKQYPSEFKKIKIENNASIGAGAIVLGGVVIGAFSMIGAGALVTKNVPCRALVVGTPAKITGWLNEDGTKMEKKNEYFVDNFENKWIVEDNVLRKAKI
ncbi:acyltransferase [Flavobacterium sp. 123]|uniref:acyltransferase n=1 Tax=Flavobacterium sp. 123 TaxID=2135627 RepID=UPI000EAC27EF|nr:acyltransferase [Flavobacterium sp. 123]RKS99980.1 carbonic anhydrase/acetyltransferase-like protein (isoleucine patch superfamily) [Flavobacterium sp. 123]